MKKIAFFISFIFLGFNCFSQRDADISSIINNPDVQEVLMNMRWQWRTATDRGSNKIVIAGVEVYGSTEQYAVITSLKTYIDGNEDAAFAKFITGQSHAPSVQDMYKAARSKYGVDVFWTLVCSASWPDHPSDLRDAAQNIGWSKGNNLGNYQNAKSAFDSGQNIRGMYYLMQGQAHNQSIQETYRATFRDNKKQFIALVQ